MLQRREQFESWTLSLASSVSAIAHDQNNTAKTVLNGTYKQRNPVNFMVTPCINNNKKVSTQPCL